MICEVSGEIPRKCPNFTIVRSSIAQVDYQLERHVKLVSFDCYHQYLRVYASLRVVSGKLA